MSVEGLGRLVIILDPNIRADQNIEKFRRPAFLYNSVCLRLYIKN